MQNFSNINPSSIAHKKDIEQNAIVYYNVSECVLRLANGENETIAKSNPNELLVVNILSCSNGDFDFVNSVFKNYKKVKTLEDFAELCGFNSTKTFSRHFKKNFNMTPKQWLLEIKKNELLHYLKNTNVPFRKIAQNLGFANVWHLNNFCVKKIGLKPSEIRGDELKS